MNVKFATYNIQYGVGQDGLYDLARAITTLEDQDIICLQEVTTNWRACQQDDQASLLSTGLRCYAVFAPAYEIDNSRRRPDGTIVNARRGFGNMVLSRWPIVYSRPHSLPRPPTEVPPEFHPSVDFPRVALEAVIDIGGTALRVISLHLSQLPGAQRQAQIDAIKQLAAALPGEAALWEDDPRIAVWSEGQRAPDVPQSTLLFGDFNFEPDSADHARMTAPLDAAGMALSDGWPAATERQSEQQTCVENDGRLSRLDYLFASPDLAGKIHTARVGQANRASDHFPVFFTLEI